MLGFAMPNEFKHEGTLMTKDAGERASESRHYEVSHKDLPLCCPMPEQRVWDAHPRVYLPIEEERKVTCPYCGAKYTLTD